MSLFVFQLIPKLHYVILHVYDMFRTERFIIENSVYPNEPKMEKWIKIRDFAFVKRIPAAGTNCQPNQILLISLFLQSIVCFPLIQKISLDTRLKCLYNTYLCSMWWCPLNACLMLLPLARDIKYHLKAIIQNAKNKNNRSKIVNCLSSFNFTPNYCS